MKDAPVDSEKFKHRWGPHNPAPRKQKGMVSNKTKIRTQLGMGNLLGAGNQWDAVQDYTSGTGALKLIREMNKLKGYKYVAAWQAVVEYYKPKLQRTTIDDSRPPSHTVNNILNVLSFEDKSKLLEVLRQTRAIETLQATKPDTFTESDRVGEEVNDPDNMAS